MINAKRVDPQYQESPFWRDYSETDNGTCYDGITIININRFGTSRVKYTDLFDTVMEYADKAAEAAEDFKSGNGAYYAPFCKNYTQYITETFKPARKLSTRAIHRLKTLFAEISDEYSAYVEYYKSEEIAEIMSIISGEKYVAGKLTGYCQGDVVSIIYKESEWTKEGLDALETEYWNGGSEYEIVSTEDPDTSLYMYFTEWDDDKIKAEIAAEFGVSVEDVVMEG